MMGERNYWEAIGSRQLGRRRLLGSAAAGGTALLLAGCGKSRGGAAPQSASSSGATGKPRLGGSISLRMTTDPFDWDMSYDGKSFPNGYGALQAYDSLLSFKHGPGVKFADLTLEPALAERWETPDPQTYIFHMRQGAKFANLPPLNGRALTAADVKWSYEYASRTGQFADKKLPQGQYSWFFEGMTGVETPDASTVTVRFKGPFVPFINYTATSFNPIVAHEIYDQDGNFHNRIVGSGPFQLDMASSQKGSRWIWKKNPNYWDAGKPYIDQVAWLVLPDDATTFAAFRSHQADIIGDLSQPIGAVPAQQIQRDNPNAVAFEFAEPAPAEHVYINMHLTPLNDVRVRRAMLLGVDQQEFINSLTGGKGFWAAAGAFSTTYTQEELKQMLRPDLSQAKQLLNQAGYANGLELEAVYPGDNYGAEHVSACQLFQAQMKKIGITLNLKNLDKDTYSNDKKKGTYQIAPNPKSGDLIADIDSYLYTTFHSGNRSNYGGISDPNLDALLDAQRRESDAAKRNDILRQAVKLIADQAYAVALYAGAKYQFSQPYVKNYAPNFGSVGWPLDASWVEK